MGYFRHHCIVVTAFQEKSIAKAYSKADEIFSGMPLYSDKAHSMVSPVISSPVNDFYTFFIGPDGSKEGWQMSDDGEKARSVFIDWLKECREKGEDYFTWALVQYGDENGRDMLEDGSFKDKQ